MQELNRTRNTKRNIVWGFANRAVTILGPFVTRTFLIQCLGIDYLGINTLYVSIMQILSLAELGFATAVVYGMYKPVAEGDIRQVAAYLNFFKSVYRWVGLIILVAGLVLMPFLGYLVTGSWPDDVGMQAAFAIYLVNTVISYFLYAYKQSLLNAYQRNDAVSKVNLAFMLAQYALQVGVLVVWPNFYAYAVVYPVCTIGSNVAAALATRRLLPEFSDRSLGSEKLSGERRAAIRKQVAGLLFQQICYVTRNSFSSMAISMFIGIAAVACYDNYFVIMNGLNAFLTVLGTSMTAAVGNSVAVESKEKNFNDLRLFVFLYSLLSIGVAASLISVYQPFMRIWVGDELMLGFEIPVLMTLYFYVRTMGDMRAVYVNATGIWWEQRWRALFEGIGNLVLNFTLVQFFGVAGVVMGSLISLFFLNFVYGSHLAFKFYFGLDKARLYYIDHLIYLGVGALVCVTTYAIVSFIPEGGLVMFCAKLAAAIVCAGALLLLAFFWTKRFKNAFRFVKRAVFKKG